MNGIEWLIEAFECSDKATRELPALESLFTTIVSNMALRPVGNPLWHRFPSGGGVTGIWLLQESHLTVHTFPEYRSACVNIFCCRPRQPLDWLKTFEGILGATEVRVREHQRIYRRDD